MAIANTSSANESTRICAIVPFSPEAAPRSCHDLIFSRSSFRWNSAVGVNSIATPVKCRDASSSVNTRLPRAGSCTVILRPATFTSTTKWFMSQCSTAGSRSFPSESSGTCTPRAVMPMVSAICATFFSVMPFNEGERRTRIAERSVRWPWKEATIARHAMPHSGASLCRMTGTRGERSSERAPI